MYIHFEVVKKHVKFVPVIIIVTSIVCNEQVRRTWSFLYSKKMPLDGRYRSLK